MWWLDYGLNNSGLIFGKEKGFFSFLCNVQTFSGTHPDLFPVDFSPRAFSSWRVKLTIQLHLLTRLRTSVALPPSTLYGFMVWRGTTVSFTFVLNCVCSKSNICLPSKFLHSDLIPSTVILIRRTIILRNNIMVQNFAIKAGVGFIRNILQKMSQSVDGMSVVFPCCNQRAASWRLAAIIITDVVGD